MILDNARLGFRGETVCVCSCTHACMCGSVTQKHLLGLKIFSRAEGLKSREMPVVAGR